MPMAGTGLAMASVCGVSGELPGRYPRPFPHSSSWWQPRARLVDVVLEVAHNNAGPRSPLICLFRK